MKIRHNNVIAVVPFLPAVLGKNGKMLSVKEAVEAARKAPPQPAQVFSHFLTEIRNSKGRLKFRHGRPGWRHNLTTDTASGFTNRRDWQSKAMGGGLPPVATMTGNATSVAATTLTNTGAAFPTASQGLAGCIVVAGPRATSSSGDAISFGMIQSNTGTVLTIDRWYSGGTWGAGTTPNGTSAYTILPGQMPAMFLAVTENATAAAASDTTLTSELAADGFTRQLAVWSHTAAATTYALVTTFTATGTRTINKEAVFGGANITGGGVMPFESAEPNPPTLVSGDTLQQTVQITIN